MKGEVNIKQEHIVEAAIKRFSHFGIGKTTLTEIAEDLSISKPSLFYYFEDKNSLIAAVANKIVNEFLDGYKTAIETAVSVEDALLSLVEVKRKYFKKYFLLAIKSDSAEINSVKSASSAVYLEARKKTVELVTKLLEDGIQQKVLKELDPVKTSQLLLETLSAFEYSMKVKNAIPGLTEIEELFDKEREVLLMILNGLKATGGKTA